MILNEIITLIAWYIPFYLLKFSNKLFGVIFSAAIFVMSPFIVPIEMAPAIMALKWAFNEN